MQSMAQNTNLRQPVRVSRGVFDLAGASFAELPGTKQELTTLGQLFGKRSVLLMNAQASEASFKSAPLRQFRVIHFAVHGVSAPKYPERAALVLGTDPENREDGLLQAREIVSLPLNADLVTLASCETGAGKLEGEEGAESLERAFLIAGAKTVVATLWNADDTFTAALIKAFYGHLARAEDKGSALRNAKLDMIQEFGDQALPYYWAGFTMQGDSASPLSISIQ
jgi:CHAT domain-containing protein